MRNYNFKDHLIHIRPLIFDGLLVFIFLTQFERFLTMIFVLNFSTAGPNVTVVLLLLFMSGLIELVLPWPHSQRMLSGAFFLTILMILVSFIPIPLIATVGSVFGLLFVTPIITSRMHLENNHFIIAVIIAVMIQIVIRSILGTISYYATSLGIILLLSLVLLAIYLWVTITRTNGRNLRSLNNTTVDITPILGFLLIQFLFLGFPNVISTWYFRNYLIISFSGILGLSMGALLVYEQGNEILERFPNFLLVILYLLSLIDLLWINILSIISYFIVQLSSCVILYNGYTKSSLSSKRAFAVKMGFIQILMILILFLQISAGNWAFMPSILNFTRGHAATFIFIAGLFLPLSNINLNESKRIFDKQINIRNPIRVILLTIIIVTMSGVVGNELFFPKRNPDSTNLKIMTYNIHQYFSIGQTGQYNIEQIKSVIEESGADIIGLQESEGARITSSNMNGVQWLAQQLGMAYYYYGPPTSAQIYGVSLISRYPIITQQWVSLPAEESIERTAIVVEIDTGTHIGRIHIVVTHFQTGRYEQDRFSQAEKIVNITEDFTRAIIMGDFNTQPDNEDPAFVILNSTYSDAWIFAPGNDPSTGETSYSDSGQATSRIDYIWLKGSWTVLECTNFGNTRASDHRAVYAELIGA